MYTSVVGGVKAALSQYLALFDKVAMELCKNSC